MDFLNKMMGNKQEQPVEDARTTQIRREIESLEVRKNTAQSVADKEKSELEHKKNEVLLEAGRHAYENYVAHKEETDGLSQYWTQIADLNEQLRQKDEKMREMQARFDEEIDIMKKELGYIAAPVPTQDAAAASGAEVCLFCPNCGASINAGDSFCEKCGTKL